MGPRWPGNYLSSLESVYLNPKSNLRVGCIQKSASILPSVSFDPRSFTENLFLSKLLLILLHYFIIFGLKQYSKKHEQKRWETRRRRVGEIAFVYQNNKRNESVTLASKYMLCIFGKTMEKVSYIWKIKLSRPWTVQFLTSTDVRIRNYSSMFGFPWKNPSVNSQWYIKNECSDVA